MKNPLLEIKAELASSRPPEVPNFDCTICTVSRGTICTVLHSNRITSIVYENIFEIKVLNYVGKHSINLSNYLVYYFFWATPRLLNFTYRRFGTLCSVLIGGKSKKKKVCNQELRGATHQKVPQNTIRNPQ